MRLRNAIRYTGTRTRALQAQELRASLIALLAPKGLCTRCGEPPGVFPLEIHHIDGRDWALSKTSQLCRARRYWREHRAGVRLAAWCRSCNASDGATRFAWLPSKDRYNVVRSKRR